MSGRRVFGAIVIVVSLFGMVARYQYQKSEQRKRENMLRSLAEFSRNAEREREDERARAAAAELANEPRDLFDSTLPQEYLDEIRQAAGQDCKLLEVNVSKMGLDAKVSIDGQTLKEYRRWKHKKNLDGPFEVKIVGDGKVADNILKPTDVDLSLVPKMAKEAFERAALEGSTVDGARLKYPLFINKGDGPEWTVNLSVQRGEKWEFKNVTFNAKGKFKEVN